MPTDAAESGGETDLLQLTAASEKVARQLFCLLRQRDLCKSVAVGKGSRAQKTGFLRQRKGACFLTAVEGISADVLHGLGNGDGRDGNTAVKGRLPDAYKAGGKKRSLQLFSVGKGPVADLRNTSRHEEKLRIPVAACSIAVVDFGSAKLLPLTVKLPPFRSGVT